MYKKILLGVDDSEDAVRAAKRVMELEQKDISEVIVFHSVLHHLSEINPGFAFVKKDAAFTLTIHEDFVKAGKKVLNQVEKQFKDADLNVETRLIYDVSPEDYIKKTVKKEGIDLVVLGCKGKHSKLSRALIGTIPDHVINNTSCDVLIIR